MENVEAKKRIVIFFLEKGILLSNDVLEKIEVDQTEQLYSDLYQKINQDSFLVLNADITAQLIHDVVRDTDWREFDKARVIWEKRKDKKQYDKFLEFVRESPEKKEGPATERNVQTIFSYTGECRKINVQHFVSYFNKRYETLRLILQNRPELDNLTSISRILPKKERENISLIGMVKDIEFTKNNNCMLTVEDPTGMIKVLVNKNKPEMFEEAASIVPDEVIGITGVNGDRIVFCNNILWPEVPMNRDLKKAEEEVYAIFISDLHVGSEHFLEENFLRFLKWIKGEVGSEAQKEIAKKVKYIFLVGDLVDGVGIYPGQEDELTIKDVYDQYRECARYLKEIPEDKEIIICAGNHDSMRISEPQPLLYKDFAEPIWELPNVHIISNPGVVNIHKSEDFPGFDVLLYHGYSFDYYAANVNEIRQKGGYDRADIIMKFLLKRRHLAPTHSSTLYLPTPDEDNLIINTIPDIFITGHIHKTSVSTFRNITLVCGSCWQSTTPFQEKVGHKPEPGRVPILNLQNRDIKILKF